MGKPRRKPRQNQNQKPQTQDNQGGRKIVDPRGSGFKVYDQIVKDASSIYFNNLIGTDITLKSWKSEIEDTNKGRLPGAMVLPLYPNFRSRSNMLDVAATSIYTFVRHANAGKTNYEAPDLMMYLIAIGEVYVGLSELIRLYGYSMYFNARNLYSEQIVKILGFEPIVRAQLANLRVKINSLIHKVKAFAVPKVFNYFSERMSEVSQIYTDEDTDFAQYYVFVPGVLGTFNATKYDTGGCIEFDSNWSRGSLRNALDQADKIDDMLTVLRHSEDNNIISGDLLKAYGQDLFILEPIDENYTLVPVYDPLVLAQIQNAHVPSVHSLDIPDLKQEGGRMMPGRIVISNQDTSVEKFYQGERYVNSNGAEIDGYVTYALTKYQIVAEPLENDVVGFINSANITVLGDPEIIRLDIDPEAQDRDKIAIRAKRIRQFLSVGYELEDIMLISKFSNHPYLYVPNETLPIGDMHYVAKISEVDTERLNDARFIMSFQTMQMS